MSTKQQTKLYSPEREKRVADALRENLRKRKVQQQNKKNPHAPESAAGASSRPEKI